jgi:hypothetical protein
VVCPGGGGYAYDGAGGGAGEGGAIYNSAVLTLTNCTLVTNSAVGGIGGAAGYDLSSRHRGGPGGIGYGGGVYNAGTFTLISCTIAGNSAVAGSGGAGDPGFIGSPGSAQPGGIFQAGSGSNALRNDLIATNTATTSAPDVYGPFTSQGYNLVGKSDDSSGFTNGVNQDLVGTVSAPVDPTLDPNGPQNNGGPTATIALLSTSPAVNAGTSTGAPATDQRGFARAGAPDIGAFEFNGTFFASNLRNISTRGFTQTGDNVMIAGIIVSGSGPKTVLVRALGPTIGGPPFNVANALADPILELHFPDGGVVTNDNWVDAPNKQAIIDSGLAPPNNLESAILADLNPGNYTAILQGVNNTTGNALIEA